MLDGEDRSEVMSSVLGSEDYRVVLDQLGELGFRPILENAIVAESEEVRPGIGTKRLGMVMEFAPENGGIPLMAAFLLEPFQRSFVYRLDRERNEVVLVAGTVQGKNIILQSGGASPLSSCPPCYALVNECVSIRLDCVLSQCSDCLDACLTWFPTCIACIVLWCGLGSLYLCCNFQLVCEPCTPAMRYLPECMGCF